MNLLDRFLALPRAARWAAAAATFLAAYFILVEPALDATTSARVRAETLETAIQRRTANASSNSTAAQDAALAAARFGERLPPGGPDRAAALNACLEQIFREATVTNLSIRARAPVPLAKGPLASVIQEGSQAARLMLDVEFEAAPNAAAAIISHMERAPEITSLNRVVIRRVEREGKRTVQVSVTPEAWIIMPKGAAR